MRGIALLLMTAAMAGCATSPSPVDLDGQQNSLEEDSRVIVGIVDSGITPYHEAFQDPNARLPTDILDARSGKPPIPLSLAQTGSYEERVRADQAMWNSLQTGELYWFEGTRILAISVEASTDSPLILDRSGHGRSVASVVKNISPDAWIVLVEARGAGLTDPVEEYVEFFTKSSQGIAWLADQPWVDMISLSIGFEGNPPFPQWEPFVQATRKAATDGKLVAVAAFNLPTPTIQSGPNGPPWVITVGGVESRTHGEQPRAAKIVDVVSDYTRIVARREPDQYGDLEGTSFATPVVAGNLAEAIYQLRLQADWRGGSRDGSFCVCAGREVTAHELREVLNASATYWDATQYDPLNYSEDPVNTTLFATIPILPAPWLQMGWGYVGDTTWQTMLAILQGEEPPPKPLGAREYMAQQQALREAYWSLPR